ncbi:hypothetical protein C8R47DRAFT_1189440 [Mycena vitilis]|nr:hypothetical protein C8R47DRAFT_1189440 [Mycena vitilis]
MMRPRPALLLLVVSWRSCSATQGHRQPASGSRTNTTSSFQLQSVGSTSATVASSNPALSVTFLPIAPQAFNRYDHCRYIDPIHVEVFVPPLSRSIYRESLADWLPHEHPEGALYFRHNQMVRIAVSKCIIYITPPQNIFTDVDLYHPVDFRHLTFCKDEILRRPAAERVLESSTVDLVLDVLAERNGHLKCAYYFVDHAERIVFWIEKFRMNDLAAWHLVPGISSASHIKRALTVEYWRHCEYFPVTLPISTAVLKELRRLVVFSISDTMVSPTTTVTLPVEFLFQMLSIVDTMSTEVGEAEGNTKLVGSDDQAWGVVIARFMGQLAVPRFYYCHGEPIARLDSTMSMYGPTPRPTSSYFVFFSPLLFNSPINHFKNINAMYNDRILSCTEWKQFIQRLRLEWQETILFGTLILNANVGFLAISNGTLIVNTSAQTLSCISVLLGFGAVMTGLILSRQYGETFLHPCSSADLSQFFKRRSVGGLQSLAILYSLPSASMIWGMITFLLAFLVMAVESFDGSRRVLFLVVFASIALLAFGYLGAEHWIRLLRRNRALRGSLRLLEKDPGMEASTLRTFPRYLTCKNTNHIKVPLGGWGSPGGQGGRGGHGMGIGGQPGQPGQSGEAGHPPDGKNGGKGGHGGMGGKGGKGGYGPNGEEGADGQDGQPGTAGEAGKDWKEGDSVGGAGGKGGLGGAGGAGGTVGVAPGIDMKTVDSNFGGLGVDGFDGRSGTSLGERPPGLPAHHRDQEY